MENYTTLICAAIVGAILLCLAIVRFAMWFQWFQKELRYVNKEIARTLGKEQQHWRKRKKRLLLSLIPFVGY